MAGEVQTYALIQDGIVINTILWHGDTENWSPPAGQIAVLIGPEDGSVSIGSGYLDGQFTPSTA